MRNRTAISLRLAGGLPLAYPRIMAGALLRRELAVPLCLRYLLALIHPGPKLVNLGKGNLRHRQILPLSLIYEIDIAELIAGDRRGSHIVQILLEIIGAARHIKKGQAAQLLAR